MSYHKPYAQSENIQYFSYYILLISYFVFCSPIRSFCHASSSDEDADEWRPPEPKPPSKTGRDTTARTKKAPAKRAAKPKVPKEPKVSQNPKQSVSRKLNTAQKNPVSKLNNSAASSLVGTKRKQTDERFDDKKDKTESGGPEEGRVCESGSNIRMKEEVSLISISVQYRF